jgi:hypothetical protein
LVNQANISAGYARHSLDNILAKIPNKYGFVINFIAFSIGFQVSNAIPSGVQLLPGRCVLEEIVKGVEIARWWTTAG